jgi:hypothetical protein
MDACGISGRVIPSSPFTRSAVDPHGPRGRRTGQTSARPWDGSMDLEPLMAAELPLQMLPQADCFIPLWTTDKSAGD